jgi:nicotinamide-nucleotide adenylyltransferase
MRGLVIGRFQPFHLGHRKLIEELADDVDEVVVGIGSAGRSHSVKNPFTSGERVHIVQDVLDGMDAKTFLIPIDDVAENAMWVRRVEILCPAFDVAYTNNHLVERLFEEAGYEVRGTPLYDREKYHGAGIRQRMIDGDDWRHLVPDEVVDAVEEIGGVERLQKIDKDDEPEDADEDV